ncbi:ABC transporter permease [Spirochaeta lutea]|uniref:ABC3 transporter permease C-terminal domain-containing protein n=1 Tax=Spirochaeta lutea TaxID=1480694 RepID=A0A098QYJ8_9SPIO|nr:FtsX-like permease family protein [Spirochaeta lutea]KGE72739.1 hypothetical protein DC28_06805 [Spirochaeta lutea]
MPILLRIALRNLREHKGKTLIVGTLIALGVLMLILGNSLLATAAEGTRKSIIDNYTAHVMVRAKSDTPVSIAGAGGFTGDITGKTIPNYSRVYDIATSIPEVGQANPQITYFARIDYSTENQNQGAIAPIFGIEPDTYQSMFTENIEVLEGRFLEPGEQGIVLPEQTVADIRENLEIDVQVGDELKLQSGGESSGLNIRRLPLVGVYRFAVDNAALSGFAFVDAQSVRSMAGLVVGTSAIIEIDEADTTLLNEAGIFGEEDLFGEDSLFGGTDSDLSQQESLGTDFSEEGLLGILGDTSQRESLSQPDSGAWSYLLLRLDSLEQAPGVISQLNAAFEEAEIAAEAVDWATASGGVATFNQAFGIFFNVVVLIITIVSVIIIMNTLVISVIERTSEIGTMRALGAQRKFIRRMFILETMSISVVFGMIGLGLGALLVGIFNATGLTAPNAFFEIIFGGETLRPVLTFGAVFQALLMMLGIGYLSSLYPVSVALKIQPVKAIAVS